MIAGQSFALEKLVTQPLTTPAALRAHGQAHFLAATLDQLAGA